MIEPKYVKPYNNSIYSNEQEEERIQSTKILLNDLLDKYEPEFNNTYKTKLPKIKEEAIKEIFYLSKIFLLCINEIRKNNDEESRVLLILLRDLENLDILIQEYSITKSQKTLRDIKILTQPYVPEMMKTIQKCRQLFNTEDEDFSSFKDLD